MKKVKVEDMKVTITFGENEVDKERFYSILSNIVKRLEKEEKEGKHNEKECSTYES